MLFLNIYVITGTNLRRAATFDVDSNVRAASTKLQDHKLLSKLASGDIHALDAYYHPSCLTALYNGVRNIRSSKEQEDSKSSRVASEAIALAELVMYIDEAPRPMVFQLSDLAKMYSCLLEQLGGHVPRRVNSTRLKDRLLAQIPDLGAYTEGKEVKLAFSGDIGAALHFHVMARCVQDRNRSLSHVLKSAQHLSVLRLMQLS